MNIVLILAAILPGLLICGLIYFLDKHEKEGAIPLLITFGLGMLSALPAVGIQMLASKLGLDSTANFGFLLIYVFIVVAFSEELVKIVMLLVYPYPRPFFNEPMDGIVYSIMVGMGFAVVENVIYAYNYGMDTILVRAFTAVPAHAIFAVFMGYFIGLAKFHTNKWRLIGVGFAIAVFIHGVYDFFILQQYYDWLMGFGLVTIIIGGYLGWLLIKDHRENSPFKVTVESEATEQTETDV
ncbi:MAG: PrsW family intramembrane metalloprotease [Saprospiraceae bacterium]